MQGNPCQSVSSICQQGCHTSHGWLSLTGPVSQPIIATTHMSSSQGNTQPWSKLLSVVSKDGIRNLLRRHRARLQGLLSACAERKCIGARRWRRHCVGRPFFWWRSGSVRAQQRDLMSSVVLGWCDPAFWSVVSEDMFIMQLYRLTRG